MTLDLDTIERLAKAGVSRQSDILELIAEVRGLREDKARLDSGRIMLRGWDDFVGEHKIDSRGNDLRKMIDEAMELAAKEKA